MCTFQETSLGADLEGHLRLSGTLSVCITVVSDVSEMTDELLHRASTCSSPLHGRRRCSRAPFKTNLLIGLRCMERTKQI
jgi:hypothetical protein